MCYLYEGTIRVFQPLVIQKTMGLFLPNLYTGMLCPSATLPHIFIKLDFSSSCFQDMHLKSLPEFSSSPSLQQMIKR